MDKVKICGFFAGFFLLLAVTSLYIDRIFLRDYTAEGGRYEAIGGIENEKADSIDVLILGDSESYTSISPMVLWKEDGITSYVCGEPGQHISNTYYMLSEALEKQHPGMVLLETNVLFRSKSSISDAGQAVENSMMHYFSVFRYHNLWKHALLADPISDPYYFKGFHLRTKISAYNMGNYMKKTSLSKEVSAINEQYLGDIVSLCKEKGIQLVLYSAPSPVNYNYKKHNSIKTLSRKYNVPYVDYNVFASKIGINWTEDSMDRGDHLNIYGAEKVSGYMAKYLQKHYTLKDHRMDPSYQTWNDLAKRYYKIISGHKIGKSSSV